MPTYIQIPLLGMPPATPPSPHHHPTHQLPNHYFHQFHQKAMDELTAATILDILRQDVADSLEAQKGKKADGEMTDAQLALYTWQNELNQRVTRLEDFKMARSLSRVIHADANALEMASQEETQASQDRQLALRLGGGGNQGEGAQLLQQQQQQQPRPTGGLPNNEPTRAGSSREAAFQSSGKATRHECVACNKTKPSFETIETPCSHRYCQQCTIKLFESAITDESLFPPRCCRVPIPLDPIRGLLGNDLSTRFEVRTIERSDPNRIYCSNPLCSQHILPRQVVENVGTCTSCSQRTCTGCKRAAHQGDCPDETQEVLQMAQEEGWMRCFHCQNVVELTTGCNHITYGLSPSPSPPFSPR